MDWLWAFPILAVVWLICFVAGLAGNSARLKKSEKELADWSGVIDVKREITNRLSDADERKRVRDKYNKAK